jgi:hypothetical protein
LTVSSPLDSRVTSTGRVHITALDALERLYSLSSPVKPRQGPSEADSGGLDTPLNLSIGAAQDEHTEQIAAELGQREPVLLSRPPSLTSECGNEEDERTGTLLVPKPRVIRQDGMLRTNVDQPSNDHVSRKRVHEGSIKDPARDDDEKDVTCSIQARSHKRAKTDNSVQ